ncbi:DUF4381 domain-containing protein [Shewanella avicenniae]|uniref:DUF4381 domain-containing protein n=1 Tax=Shewanella avicenniae TaxID=2814294 RepID=A0ABX7QNM6_9GAMM|nr:DUF4381 domain-containing protein [Shewanella avicenniae]QSX32318.1 DUF4381 domain-containing protein [Shewanella avicenniae]
MSVNSPATNPALASMQDIQLPADIGWWPLAPGVWLVLIALVFLLLWACFWLVKTLRQRKQQAAAAKDALSLLGELDQDDPQLAVTISALLKRTAISYGQRQQVAGLVGDDWYRYLDQVLPESDRGQFAGLLDGRYRRSGSEIDAQQLCNLTRRWLQQAPHYFNAQPKNTHSTKEAAC